MLALKIIGIIVLIFVLIGMIKVGISIDFIDDRLTLGIIVFGKKIVLKKKDKKDKKKKPEEEKEKAEKDETKKKPEKKKKTKKEKEDKPVKYSLSTDDIKEIIVRVFKNFDNVRKGFNFDRFLLHLTVATDDPYNTAVLFGKINSLIDFIAPYCSNRYKCKDLDVWTDVDFNHSLPRIDIGFDLTIRLHSFTRRLSVVFDVLWVIIKCKSRGLILRITDKEEYDYEISLLQDRKDTLKLVINTIKNKKADKADSDNDERKIS